MTQQLIKETLVTIMTEKPLSKITVKELCERANINRTTFYKYYDNPQDVMDKIQTEMAKEIEKKIQANNDFSIPAIFTVFLDTIYSKRDFVIPLFKQYSGTVFREAVLELNYDEQKNIILRLFPEVPEWRQEWLYHFVADGCTSVLGKWIEDGMIQPTQEVAAFLMEIIRSINTTVHLDF